MRQEMRAEFSGPALFLGAMLGGIVGTVAQQVAPGYVATPGAYALVGMGTCLRGDCARANDFGADDF